MNSFLWVIWILWLVCLFGDRDGLSTRTGAGSEEIQLRIDPMHSDLDDEISGLHGQVSQLKNVTNSCHHCKLLFVFFLVILMSS